MAQTEETPGGRSDALPDREFGQGGKRKVRRKTKCALKERESLGLKGNSKGRKARFKQEKWDGRSGNAAGDYSTRRMVKGF